MLDRHFPAGSHPRSAPFTYGEWAYLPNPIAQMNASTQTNISLSSTDQWPGTHQHQDPPWSSWDAQPPHSQWNFTAWETSQWHPQDQNWDAWSDWQTEGHYHDAQHHDNWWNPTTTWADWRDGKDWNNWQDW